MKILLLITIFSVPQVLRCSNVNNEFRNTYETLLELINNNIVRECVYNIEEKVTPRSSHIWEERVLYNSSFIRLECSSEFEERILEDYEFIFNKNGDIFVNFSNNSYNASNYCLTVNRKCKGSYCGGLQWLPKLCFSPISVNVCCSKENMNMNNSCDVSDENLISLKEIVSSDYVKINYFNQDSLNCSKGEIISEIFNTSDTNFISNYISGPKSTDKYCLSIEENGNETTNYSVYYCRRSENSEICEGRCVRKCCPKGYLYDYSKHECDFTNSKNSEWKPTLYSQNNEQQNLNDLSINFTYSFPLCQKFFHLKPHLDPEEKFYILTNGNLFVDKYDKAFPHNRYCTDYFKYDKLIAENSLVCFPETSDKQISNCDKIRTVLDPILMTLSCVFLVLTLIIYCILPDLYSKINGKCVISSTIALLMAYICFIIMDWGSKNATMSSCQVLGIFTQFFSLASFFWLNVMCYDVWRALRSQRHVSPDRYSKRKKFLKYSLYAWGIPASISIITCCLQFLRGEDSKYLAPGFGINGCFFPTNDSRPSWAYFYGFISVLMAINLGCFIHLLVILHRERTLNDSMLQIRSKRQVMWMKLYMKLFCVMGVPWVFEIFSWIEGSCNLWILTDSLNALRGLFIFVIFVCKKNILNKVKSQNIFLTSSISFMSTSSENAKSLQRVPKSTFYIETPS